MSYVNTRGGVCRRAPRSMSVRWMRYHGSRTHSSGGLDTSCLRLSCIYIRALASIIGHLLPKRCNRWKSTASSSPNPDVNIVFQPSDPPSRNLHGKAHPPLLIDDSCSAPHDQIHSEYPTNLSSPSATISFNTFRASRAGGKIAGRSFAALSLTLSATLCNLANSASSGRGAFICPIWLEDRKDGVRRWRRRGRR